MVTARNCSCPAVSQIWALALLPSLRRIALEVNYIPIVGFILSGFLPLSKVYIKFVFPTPASPRTITKLRD